MRDQIKLWLVNLPEDERKRFMFLSPDEQREILASLTTWLEGGESIETFSHPSLSIENVVTEFEYGDLYSQDIYTEPDNETYSYEDYAESDIELDNEAQDEVSSLELEDDLPEPKKSVFKKVLDAVLLIFAMGCIGLGGFLFIREKLFQKHLGDLQGLSVSKIADNFSLEHNKKNGSEAERERLRNQALLEVERADADALGEAPSFDEASVTNLTPDQVRRAEAANVVGRFGIGAIKLPSLGLELPILEGANVDTLAVGIATMKPGQAMGQGNYALAGHNVQDPSVMFSALPSIEKGAEVELVNYATGHSYKYEVVSVEIIEENETYVMNDSQAREYKKPIVTLITCTDDQLQRYMVRAVLKD